MGIYLDIILSLLITFQLLFVAVFLFTHKKGNKRNNWILGLIFFLFSISMADLAILVSGIEISLQNFHILDDVFLILYGPLIYFYTKGVLIKDFKFKKKNFIHFIPYILFQSILLIEIFSLSQEGQVEVAQQIERSDLPIRIFIISSLMYLHIFVYLWYANKTMSAYRGIIKEKYSSINRIDFDWLSFIIRSFALITLIALVNNVIPLFGNRFFHYGSMFALLIFTFYFVNRVLLKALNQPEIFSGIALKDFEKYSGSNLGQDEINTIKNKLVLSLEEDKLYLNPDLSLKDLADHIQTSPKILSQVINQHFDQKFYDFINSHRCEEVKIILAGQDQKITISEAMYQSGFNSKSSFNKEFKKLTGQTPTAYKKSIQIS